MENQFVDEAHGTSVTLYREDCLSATRARLDKGSVDVVVTSPPYNLGIEYQHYDDTQPREEYLDWIAQWGKEVSEILSERGSLFLNLGAKPSDPWGPFEVVFRLREFFVLQNVIHWIKSIAIDRPDPDDPSRSTSTAFGHYKPINSRRFINDCHEYIFHLTRHGDVELDRLAIGVEYQDKSNVTRWRSAGQDRRCRGNTWFVPYKTIQNRKAERPHPATFPKQIPRMCVLLHGRERAKRVMDPFLGLGHSALACQELQVPFVGFEIDPDYFAEACALVTAADSGADSTKAAGSQLSLFG